MICFQCQRQTSPPEVEPFEAIDHEPVEDPEPLTVAQAADLLKLPSNWHLLTLGNDAVDVIEYDNMTVSHLLYNLL